MTRRPAFRVAGVLFLFWVIAAELNHSIATSTLAILFLIAGICAFLVVALWLFIALMSWLNR